MRGPSYRSGQWSRSWLAFRLQKADRPSRLQGTATTMFDARPALVRPEPHLTPRPIDQRVRIGHVHLKVSDLDRALAFYCNVLGFELTQRYGSEAAFLAAGGYHHHIGLNVWESRGGSPPPAGSTGLYHFA